MPDFNVSPIAANFKAKPVGINKLSTLGEAVPKKDNKKIKKLVISTIDKKEVTALQRLLFKDENKRTITDQLKGAIRMSRIPELNDALAKEKDADIMDEIGRYIYKVRKVINY